MKLVLTLFIQYFFSVMSNTEQETSEVIKEADATYVCDSELLISDDEIMQGKCVRPFFRVD
jgi:hypothetical protein